MYGGSYSTTVELPELCREDVKRIQERIEELNIDEVPAAVEPSCIKHVLLAGATRYRKPEKAKRPVPVFVKIDVFLHFSSLSLAAVLSVMADVFLFRCNITIKCMLLLLCYLSLNISG